MRLGVKELIAVAGLPRRSGAPELVDLTPQPVSAPCVQRLLDAGASIVATTATHQFAYGTVTPQTRNPRAPDRIAGGSSGGSAAALAAGFVDIALGTDTGGSVRIPAACCGVVGLKTTFGLIPVDGVQPLAPSLDTVGPLAGDVATCAAAFRALADSAPQEWPRRLRVGVVDELRATYLDDDVRAVWEATLQDLAADGATLVPVALPLLRSARLATDRVLAAEALVTHTDLLAARPGPEGWEPDVLDRLEASRAVDPGLVSQAREVASHWHDQVRDVFDTVDVLVSPVIRYTVPTRGTIVRLTALTNPWNLAGVPAGSVPAGRDAGGAPIGVQVIGPWHAEELVLGAMAAVERIRGGGWPPAVTAEAVPPASRPAP